MRAPGAAVANGVTPLGFAPVRAARLRLVMRKALGTQVRLVEIKLF